MANNLTKYGGNIPDEILVDYFKKLTGKIFKVLPLYEQKEKTLSDYIKFLMIELSSGNNLLVDDVGFFELMVNLESLTNLSFEHRVYKSQVFKCIGLCEKVIEFLQENMNGGDSSGL